MHHQAAERQTLPPSDLNSIFAPFDSSVFCKSEHNAFDEPMLEDTSFTSNLMTAIFESLIPPNMFCDGTLSSTKESSFTA